MHWEIFAMPIIAAFIGWGTNVIAIKMLFWPRRPIRIPLLGFEFLGVLPKRQGDIAQSIGQVLNDDLLPIQDLIDAVNTNEMREKVTHLICGNIELKINRALPRFVPEHAKDVVMRYLEDLVGREIDTLFVQLGDNISEELQTSGLLGQLVEDKIRSFDLTQLEHLVFKIAKTELRYIELFGAVVGFLIGVIQSLMLLWF